MEINAPIRIALVDDNMVSRKGFAQKAQLIHNWKVVLTAINSDDFLTQLKSLPVPELPQVVFMDIEMPGISGTQATGIAKSIYPDILYIMLTVFDDDEKIFEAIKSGASGYLLKHESQPVLEEAVTNVIEFGGAPMSPAIARKALQMLSKVPAINPQQATGAIPGSITTREKEILEYLVKGWDAKRIAAKLFISTLTVRKHIANIYTKLHIQSKAEIIHMAHKNNWVK